MPAKQPHPVESAGRIVLFRPRTRHGKQKPRAFLNSDEQPTSPPDLADYESGPDADDYRHRMTMNMIAFAFMIVLTAAGVWLAEAMSVMRKNQDCAISGRHCAPLDVSRGDR